jgi:hypothetical protein
MSQNRHPLFGNLWERFKQAWRENIGELKAIGREMVNDVRGTLLEIFFGKPEHAAESGTPWHPTAQIVTGELLGHPFAHEKNFGSMSLEQFNREAHNRQADDRGNDKDRGREPDGPER